MALRIGVDRDSTLAHSLLIDDDIDEIISRGEERTKELNSKYEGLNLDDLNNFKSESMVNNWEGKDYQNEVSNRRRLRLAFSADPFLCSSTA